MNEKNEDCQIWEKAVGSGDEENSNRDMSFLEFWENIACVMVKHADLQGVPDTPEEWRGGFGMSSIYQVLLKLIELWRLNLQTDAEAKKNSPDRP